MKGNEIRSTYLKFFEKHGHRIVRSSSLVPQDDPTLLFTNAGMVQFKRTFLGEEKRDYVRATTSQKCVRAGGKHNDLENVGYTARHHTFFEMLGNFSFGDYFKEKAVEFAWDLLTNGYGLPADKLWASVYTDDDEAYDLWYKGIGIPASRMVRLGEEENFWAMGDTGPCGPCSELHLDRGEALGCGRPDCSVDCDCDRFLEIWNLVFMQYDRNEAGTLTPLPKPSIDTGLGLERLASLLQNKGTNFETDLIFPIIQRAEELSESAYGSDHTTDVAMKVIADHSRAAAFLIGDGVLPSNDGRGYVLRRIMRRAIRYGRNIGLTKPFLHETTKVVFDIMRPNYPELGEASAFITNVIENEEARFSETLDHGLRVLNDSLGELRAKGETQIPGGLIFKLYDTFGFPVDIVQDVIREDNFSMDMDGFNQHMDNQREKSRSVVAFTGMSEAYKDLNAAGVKIDFLGYGDIKAEAEVLLVVKEGQAVESAGDGETVEVVTDRTPFYGESGGQMGDSGRISKDDLDFKVTDTVKDPTGLIIHRGIIESGRLKKGDRVNLAVDAPLRRATACNHTATHILHAALREVLGDHVKQAGSMVSPDRLRFDFTHFAQVTPEELTAIERYVNQRVAQNVDVVIKEMDAEEAFKSGATALFEEKYGDRVRVITLADFSKELCGGTHTQHTGDIGLFKIVHETSVAAGVRRIEALSGATALDHVQDTHKTLQAVAHRLKIQADGVEARIDQLLSSHKSAEKQVSQLKARVAELEAGGGGGGGVETRTIGNVQVMAKRVSVDNPAALRDLADKLKDKLGSGIVALGCESGGKALLLVVVSKDLVGRFHAGNMVKAAAAVVGGGGGGRPDMAQAGGTQPEHLDAALEKVCELVGEGA